jgi:hypothetical protein
MRQILAIEQAQPAHSAASEKPEGSKVLAHRHARSSAAMAEFLVRTTEIPATVGNVGKV